MTDTVKKNLRVAFQGAKGAYSDKVVEAYFKASATAIPCHTFQDVADLVVAGKADFGVLPVENSIIGCVTHSFDTLLDGKLRVNGEFILPIHHCLIGAKGQKRDKIKRVYSHPAALSQCEVFLREFRDAEIIPTYDTAGSVEMIKKKGLKNAAAIAGEACAEMHGLEVLARNVEDYPNNQTRFLIVSTSADDDMLDCHVYKTSIVFDTLDQPGMLYRCLGVFDRHEVNLTMLESRPHKTHPWKYHFFVDMIGHQHDAALSAVWKELREHTDFLHVFGSYPRWEETLPKKAGKRTRAKGEFDLDAPLFSLERHPEPTLVKVGDHVIGGGDFVMIAGPCGIEGRRQMMDTAKFVKECGAQFLRGGAFKPRSSPYSFQGMKEEGLKLLKEAGGRYEMPTVTEALSVETLPLVAEYADVLQIGARNMQNYVLLSEVGKLDKPVLLKRGMMATLKELLLSAEYILEKGNPNVILCERGIRTFETATRNTLDLSAVPYLKTRTHLPVIVDPSHGTGVDVLIAPMVKAALAVGADGVMVEAHVSPSTALSDGAQSLDAGQFRALMEELNKLLPAFGRNP